MVHKLEILQFFDCANINFSKFQYLSIGTIKISIHKLFFKASCFTEHFKILMAIHSFTSRSSHWRCSAEKYILKNFANFTGKRTPVLESVFNKVASLRLKACNFIEKRLQHRRFPVKSSKLLRTPILRNICERLLLLSL